MHRLCIAEIFFSLQGEARTVGFPTVFVALTDEHSQHSWLEINDVLKQIGIYGAHYVAIVGLAPLAQAACIPLLNRLCDLGYEVSLETSGEWDVSAIDNRVIKVVTVTFLNPVEWHLFENIDHLFPHDQIKFAICDRATYEWSKEILRKYKLAERCQVLFSPETTGQFAKKLADWINIDRLNVRLEI